MPAPSIPANRPGGAPSGAGGTPWPPGLAAVLANALENPTLAWQAATFYQANVLVISGGSTYICTSPHISASTFSADAANWLQLGGGGGGGGASWPASILARTASGTVNAGEVTISGTDGLFTFTLPAQPNTSAEAPTVNTIVALTGGFGAIVEPGAGDLLYGLAWSPVSELTLTTGSSILLVYDAAAASWFTIASAGLGPNIIDLSYAASVTPEPIVGTFNEFVLGTITGDLTIANPAELSDAPDGSQILFVLPVDGTGGYTLGFGTSYHLVGGTAPALLANTTVIIGFSLIGGAWREIGRSITS